MGKIIDACADDALCVNPAIYRGNPEYRKAIDTMDPTAEALDAKLNGEEFILSKGANE